jgi:signal transduction histidine kinase
VDISFDSLRLEQIIFNLVLNALEAFPEGGTVTVTLSRAPESLILNVADNGCGGTIFRIILIAKQP